MNDIKDMIIKNQIAVKNLKDEVHTMLVTDYFDEYDGIAYRKYLNGIKSQTGTYDVLFVQSSKQENGLFEVAFDINSESLFGVALAVKDTIEANIDVEK